MTLDDYLTSLRPKVQGTINLDAAFGSPSLDFFITLSSVSAILGKTGQMNYSAANSFQDAFAQEHARNSHTQYISLNLGSNRRIQCHHISSDSSARTDEARSYSHDVRGALQSSGVFDGGPTRDETDASSQSLGLIDNQWKLFKTPLL